MRTRSSRFFVVLVHLVGVSHHPMHLYLTNSPSSGIVGVQPWPVTLESVDLWTQDLAQDEPVWLQDERDGSCLGPTATFSDCGDATLWFIKRREEESHDVLARPRRFLERLLLLDRVGTRRDRLFSFQVVEMDYEVAGKDESGSQNFWQRRRRRRRKAQRSECLDNHASGISVETCRPNRLLRDSWTVTEDGRLRAFRERTLEEEPEALCLYRGDKENAHLAPCDESTEAVQFSFVRYRAVSIPTPAASEKPTPRREESAVDASVDEENVEEDPIPQVEEDSSVVQEELDQRESRGDRLPSNHDRAHALASGPAVHRELKLGSRPVLSSQNKKKSKSAGKKMPLKGLLTDANPFVLADAQKEARDSKKPGSKRSLPQPKPTLPVDDASYKLRRMHVHPYIAAAKNEVWTDPQTGLEYFTDLCQYLGRDRKQDGRHTLVGVGQYRKGFVIKVYGVAYYLSKRDVLSDPVFEPYTTMNSEELQKRPEFYEILRKMGGRGDAATGVFERTLMLKTNMQLSAETMRSSLHADWKMLTTEAKTTLIASSLEPRPADETMLKIIRSPENPGRCSCSQVAPPEYNADPNCCARGTELGFTWLKTGELEVRCNGRLMDTFPRPDIAEGIFFEYLRYDDPISPEFLTRVTDGIPFLLGPRAQLQGVTIAHQTPTRANEPVNPVVRAFTGLAQSMSSNAASMADAMQHGASDMMFHAGNAAKTLGDAAQNLGREMERRREQMTKSLVALPSTVMNMASRDQHPMQAVSDWVLTNMTPDMEEDEPIRRVSQGRVFGYPLTRWFSDTYVAPDEIGPMKIHPTMDTTRSIFLALVHLYLLLLFIVSFPGSYSTRTKLIIRRSRSNSKGSAVSFLSDHSVASDASSNRSRSLSQDRRRRRSSRGKILTKTHRVNVPSKQQSELIMTTKPNPLKKKSLSYCL